jgi:ubiquinone/menaquinone biosynthesis C-methylase UbiE
MSGQFELTTGERLISLFSKLGIGRAHFAGRVPSLNGLPTLRPEMVASLTLVCPSPFLPAALNGVNAEMLVIRGDQAPPTIFDDAEFTASHKVTERRLPKHQDLMWSDTISTHASEVGAAMAEFLARLDHALELKPATIDSGEGEVGGIHYRALGSGPPLVLLPLGLAPSQWDPLLPGLVAEHTVILLGGSLLWPVSLLEARADSSYWNMVRDLLLEAGLNEAESVLEVGSGSGALIRRVAQMDGIRARMTGVEINQFLLREAASLAKSERVEDAIEFKEGDAQELPFPDANFDLTYSSTVMEEVDASRMLPEMVRVTRPGGRVAVVVRAVDRPQWVNLPLRPELLAKVEGLGGQGVAPNGCADASLYQRFSQAGLSDVRGYPRLVTVHPSHPWGQNLEAATLSGLTPPEVAEWRAAISQAEREGDLPWIARAFHCAFGTK